MYKRQSTCSTNIIFFRTGFDKVKEELDEDGIPVGKGESDATKSESSADGNSPFKKPYFRTRNSGSVSDCSESATSKLSVESSSLAVALKAKKAQLSYYKTPMVGRETVCVFCLEKCAAKEPKLLTCLHSTCAQCFQVWKVHIIMNLNC